MAPARRFRYIEFCRRALIFAGGVAAQTTVCGAALSVAAFPRSLHEQ